MLSLRLLLSFCLFLPSNRRGDFIRYLRKNPEKRKSGRHLTTILPGPRARFIAPLESAGLGMTACKEEPI
jgi:hypothetical protein